MQPYFFPYLGYWQLYYHADIWVVLDEVQFRQFSWMRRNRIIKPTAEEGFQYISFPVQKHPRSSVINQIMINNAVPWHEEILRRLKVYRDLQAEYYQDIYELVDSVIGAGDARLVDMAKRMFDQVNSRLGRHTKYIMSSEIEFDRSEVKRPDDWSLCITLALGGSSYINPPGGSNLYCQEKYLEKGIHLSFLVPEQRQYNQGVNTFIPGLSIIDVLMFNSSAEVRLMLESDFHITRPA